MKTFGNGQTSGLPLALTSTPQTIHTAVSGSGVPERVQINIQSPGSVRVHVGIYNGSTLVSEQVQLIRSDANASPEFDELALNGGMIVKVWADGGIAYATAIVDDQANVAGTAVQNIASGLVAAVQNASRHAINVQGGTGQATEANANIMVARAGFLRNMRVVADATVGGGATITVTLRKNGADTALQQTLAAADTTVAKTDTDSVAVAAGDLITFKVACDNAGAPAANVHAAVEYVAT